jgi:hypothetical protein
VRVHYEDIINGMPPGARVIAIGGTPESGKTTLADEFPFPPWMKVHTDDHIERFPMEVRPRKLIEVVQAFQTPVIVEGCEVARMLRTGDREGIWAPDWIIWRQPETPLKGYAKGLQTIFADYLESRTTQVQMLFAP